MAQHPHLIIPTTAEPSRFTSPSSGPGERMNLPTRSRAEHAQNLISKLEALSPQAAARAGEQRALGLDDGLGIYLAFESEPNFDVKFESLDLVQSGIELCNVKTLSNNTMQATVFVPDGKLELFLKKISDYRDKNTTPRGEGVLLVQRIKTWLRASVTSNWPPWKRFGRKSRFPSRSLTFQPRGKSGFVVIVALIILRGFVAMRNTSTSL